MTHDEMIAVIKAHKEGKTIQRRAHASGDNDNISWVDTLNPIWDFQLYDYRIKPEEHYRPFKNAEEVMDAIKEHGDWVKGYNKRTILFKLLRCDEGGFNYMPYNFDNKIEFISYEKGFEEFIFADGTPFGVKEE